MWMAVGQRAAARLSMFDDLDRMDVAAWASQLAPDAVMRLGNADPVYGREACRQTMAALCAQLDELRHDLVEQWEHGAATIVEANVACTHSDGRQVTVPMVTIYRTDSRDLISDYRVYVDLAPVLRPG